MLGVAKYEKTYIWKELHLEKIILKKELQMENPSLRIVMYLHFKEFILEKSYNWEKLQLRKVMRWK